MTDSQETTLAHIGTVPFALPSEEPEQHAVELAFPTPRMVDLPLEEYTEQCRAQMEPIIEDLRRRFPGMPMQPHPNMGIIEVGGTTQEIAQVLHATGAKMLPWGIHRGTRIEIERTMNGKGEA